MLRFSPTTKVYISKFQFDHNRGSTWKPARAECGFLSKDFNLRLLLCIIYLFNSVCLSQIFLIFFLLQCKFNFSISFIGMWLFFWRSLLNCQNLIKLCVCQKFFNKNFSFCRVCFFMYQQQNMLCLALLNTSDHANVRLWIYSFTCFTGNSFEHYNFMVTYTTPYKGKGLTFWS